jgi:hypothetical protein
MPGLAATATSDLVPGPPSASWQVYPDGTLAMTASDIYGSQAGAVKGFSDAYQRSWSQTGQGMLDRLERYSSVFWAAFRFGESEGAAKKNKSHVSYGAVAGFGSGAYEVTDPPDSLGYQIDTFVFVSGDYMAVIAMGAKNAVPDHGVLMDQANRQLALIPVPTGELNSIGNGAMATVGIFAGVIALITVVALVIVLIVLLRRRRPMQPLVATAPGLLNLSPDRRYWWDGQSWQDTAARVPPGASMAPDGGQWWDGVAWRPVPPG